MLLKIPMDNKKLNFDQPLLSVRRYAPNVTTSTRNDERKSSNSRHVIPRLPPHRSELKSGPVRNPGAVPFLWEQTPGQPKEDKKPQTQNSYIPPIVPKLPPGRSRKANQLDCRNKVSQSSSGSKNEAVVDVNRTSDDKRRAAAVPRDSRTGLSHDENIKRNLRERKDEKESSDSGDSEEAYVDALDTLSRTESCFLNCSMSSVSGMDVEPSRSFSTDLQNREFMMDRFLPAAKAMASETTQSAARKQHLVQEKPQQIKKIVNENKPLLRYGPSFAKRYSHYHDNEEEEESDDDYDRRENLSAVCGLLPRFCLKSSLCLMNPVPAMSVRTRVPISSGNKVRPRSSSAGSYSETESRSDRTEPKSIDKIPRDELDDDKTKSRSESGQLESHSSSTYRDQPVPLHEEKEVPCVRFKTFEELLSDQGNPNESDKQCPVIEKTLYVDHEFITKKTDEMHVEDSSLEEFKKLNTMFGDFNILSSIDKSTNKGEMEIPIAFQENRDLNIYLATTENIQVVEDEATKSSVNLHDNYSELPIPPPLPKSPSDSWLWRAMSAKNSSVRPYLGASTNPQKQQQGSKRDIKWETIVKTTKIQHRHFHYSEGLLTTIPEA